MPLAALLSFYFFSLSSLASDWAFEPNTAVWGIFSQRSVNEGSLNPGNARARTPNQTATIEARPNWSLSNSRFMLTARPRLIIEHQSIKTSSTSSRDTNLYLRWSEGFTTWNATDTFTVAYGLQNFQWGPTESVSPSNRIFRDTIQTKDSFYVVNGKHLLRASYAPSNFFSEVLLVELSGNIDPEPEPFERHAKKALLKSELSWKGGSEYGGLVLGWRDRSGVWVGEFLNLEPVEGFSLFADLSHQMGSRAYYPTKDSTGRFTIFAQPKQNESRIYTFAAGGLRYAFENGNDWRLEAIFQEAGYSSGEIHESRSALLSNNPLQILLLSAKAEAATRSGLDFPGKTYIYSSARFPNILDIRDWNLYIRALRSLQDSSTSLLGSSENSLGDNGSLIASIAASIGKDQQELKGPVDLGLTLAYRHAW